MWRRAAFTGIACALLAAACARIEPLDEPIAAGSMHEFLQWRERHVGRLGEPVVGEFARAIAIITHQTPDYRAPSTLAEWASSSPLCRQLDGRSVREVIIDGYERTNEAIRDRIVLDRRNLYVLRLRMAENDADLRVQVAWEEQEIAREVDELRRNESRLRELRGHGP